MVLRHVLLEAFADPMRLGALVNATVEVLHTVTVNVDDIFATVDDIFAANTP